MGKLLLAVLIIGFGLSAIKRPWIGIVSYYLLAILGPQYIWWWIFDGLRVSFIIAICTFAGFTLKFLRKELDYDLLKTRLNYWILLLWFSIGVSYFWGPYVDQFAYRGLNPSQLFSMTNNICSFYFISVLLINDLKKLRYLGYVLVITILYMIYWANFQYLSQNWNMFTQGRLSGPRDVLGAAIYRDENAFGMLFVTCLPFLYYVSFELQNRWKRYLLMCAIPLGWHAIFLTGSRGALLGLGVITAFTALKSNKKYLVIPFLLVLLLVAFQLQGGNTMKQRSDMISDYEGDRSATDRITAWKGGLNMVIAHPITGVGLGSFVTALPRYIESRNMVAHNTLVQFAAESGALAGLAYIMIILCFYSNSRKIKTYCLTHNDSIESEQIKKYNNASTVSFTGLIACSMFLSLNTYEIFFFLLIFNNTLYKICFGKTETNY